MDPSRERVAPAGLVSAYGRHRFEGGREPVGTGLGGLLNAGNNTCKDRPHGPHLLFRRHASRTPPWGALHRRTPR
ncbi:hypothetical protein KCH_20040 [Kitasatospora cheerisanensis KCTC 2395]|uniref:Uncharacterized protein n=1 Tax=Kitasatospora cheerisanensis KCTC 2395 TaxID=1348663 RepID=A0A066YYC0_9ACTN|nr:hypothetical protein KCH_20040 [Kitasatospora cheerisanensis KCTC 2395]